jgi:predicted kinase
MIHLMQGFVGSGKSTRAKRIEQQTGAVRFTPDEWMSRLFGSNPSANEFAKNLQTIFDLAEPLWMAVAKAGADVILDFGFWTRASRQEMADHLRREALEYRWIRMEASIEDCRNRNRHRHETGDGLLDISDTTFNLLSERYESFTDEEFIRLS